MCLWKQLKMVRIRMGKLRGLGLPTEEAIKIANVRRGIGIRLKATIDTWPWEISIGETKVY